MLRSVLREAERTFSSRTNQDLRGTRRPLFKTMTSLDPTHENLRIANLNIRSLRKKIPDIHHILTRDKIHVLALTETHLDDNVKNSDLQIKNYKLFRKDRNKGQRSHGKDGKMCGGRGGVALYIQDHIPVKKLSFLNLSDEEMIWVEIYLPHTKPILVGCCYCSPDSKKEYFDKLCTSIKKVSADDQTKKDIFLLGDFNIDWFSDQKKRIERFSAECGLKQIVNTETRLQKCIDHIYTNIPELCDTPTSTITGCSDHNLVTVTVNERNVPEKIIIQRTYSKFNEDDFISDIEKAVPQLNKVRKKLSPKKALRKFTNTFMPIANKHAPLQKNTAQILKKFKNKQKDRKKNNFNTQSEELDAPTDLLNDYYQYYTDKSQCVSHVDLPLPEIMQNNQRSFSFVTVDDDEVRDLLESLSESETPGADEIDAKLLKIAAPYISAPISHILNRCIISGVFPSQWKKSKILLVSKRLNADFRPESVLPVLSQILEKVLAQQMKQYFNENKLFTQHQKPPNVTLDWLTGSHNDKPVRAVFLDLNSFFDTISPDMLVAKYKWYNFSDPALSLMRSFLSDRKQKVYYDGCPSHWRKMDCGLPQGSCVADFLFSVYTNDLKLFLKRSSVVMCGRNLIIYLSADNYEEVKNVWRDDFQALFQWIKENTMVPMKIKFEAVDIHELLIPHTSEPT